MGYIESIKFNESLRGYKNDSDSDVLYNISKLNIFIGGNNSGKSRFLRSIFNDKNLIFNLNHKKICEFNDLIDGLNNDIANSFRDSIVAIGNIDKRSNLEKIENITEESEVLRVFNNKIKELSKVNENATITHNSYSVTGVNSISDIVEKLKSVGVKYSEELSKRKLEDFFMPRSFKRIYIPILRGLRILDNSEDCLKERTKNDYFKNESEVNIFTGQNLYNDVLNLLCGDYKDRIHLREFEDFLGENFFDGKTISLIPKIKSDVLYVKIGEEKEYPIHELGDGIQSIIILTFNLYANKGKDVLFFIEEPELYLHPGLQRKLIDVFLSEEFDTYQYFITSHSNHLLDLSLDTNGISVYKFKKEISNNIPADKEKEIEAEFSIENVKNDDMSLLEELGVNSSSIFLSNCTIWVEGITDRLYIRKYLEIYQNEKFKNGEIKKIYLEDLHYSFLEYSGGNITHWDFLDNTEGDLASMKHSKICRNMMLIADSDGYKDDKDGKKRKRIEELEAYLGDRFYCLKAKEIENILTPDIIKKSIKKLKDGRVKDDLKDRDSELLDKCDFNIEDYKGINLGSFIDEKISEQLDIEKKEHSGFDNYEKRKKFASGSTINYKVKFCKYAIENIKTLDDMSDEAKEICEKIYKFIEESNI
ncbi:ATP-binding protein [Clostridium perfringens]|nr:ATP-binding protein [Clostridium perfringens]MDK0885797.1 ATP-binding protein [Clostridium perfringens]